MHITEFVLLLINAGMLIAVVWFLLTFYRMSRDIAEIKGMLRQSRTRRADESDN